MTAALLNELFATARLQTRLRKWVFIAGGLFLWLILAMLLHPPTFLAGFITSLGTLLGAFFTLPFKAGGFETFLIAGFRSAVYLWYLLGQIGSGVLAPDVLRHVVAVFVPFFLAYRVAVIYLDDIFELKDERTAFRYIRQTAFGIKPYRLAIENGAVAHRDQYSPLLHIGGPGRVRVNLENLAVFDRIDGSPHVVGPTVDQTDHTALIDSFEHLRDVIDLRDQMTRAEDLSLEARTRDGIRIIVRDVRLMFSVLRTNVSGATSPGEQSYSFRPDAIQNLVYNRTSGHWTEAMLSLVHEQLEEFIARHTLSQILTAIGLPELEQRRAAASRIDAQADTLYPLPKSGPGASPAAADLGPPSDFISRLEITDLFFDSLRGFPALARERGVQLHWIDVGTWHLPSAVIPQMQVEAWQKARENMDRQNELAALEEQSRLEELVRLVRDVPLIAFQKSRETSQADDDTVASLITEYLGIMRTARDILNREEKPVPLRLDHAILLASQYLQSYIKAKGEAHFIP